MSIERRPNVQFIRGEDNCEPFLKGSWAYQEFYKPRVEKTTFLEAKVQGLLEKLITQVRIQDQILRVVEIGSNTGNAIQPVIEFLAANIPQDISVEMHCIDCNNFKPEDVRLPSELPDNFTFTYHAQTEAVAFLSRTQFPFSIIHGYAIEFLVQPENLMGEPEFVEFLRQNFTQVIHPGGILIFKQGRLKENGYGIPISPLLPEEEFTEYSKIWGTNLIQRRISSPSEEG